eukprot:scaffold1324_cov73-Phaeocystis_antarctica.AAC.2
MKASLSSGWSKTVFALLIRHPANEGKPTCAGTSPPSKAAARASTGLVSDAMPRRSSARQSHLSALAGHAVHSYHARRAERRA